MEKTTNCIQSFDQIPALKNALNNLSSQSLSPTTAPTILISVASQIYQLFAPLRTVNNFSGEKSDEIIFVDKPNLLESSLQLLLREIHGHFRLAGEPTLSIPSMSLRISPALSCTTELTPLHLLAVHQQSTQDPLLLVVEDEQQAFNERWTALLQQCKVDRAPVSALLDNSVDDVVSNAAVVSTDQQATVEEDDEEVDLDIDSPPTSVREETIVQTSTVINDAEIHNEVLVSTTIESHEVSTSNGTKVEESLVIETKSTVNREEPVDEELDDVDVADVSASVTNNSGDETHVGQKRHREEEEAIVDGEPEPKRPKLEVETTTTVTTVTETVAVDMIQVE